jgi:hypothetical protein
VKVTRKIVTPSNRGARARLNAGSRRGAEGVSFVRCPLDGRKHDRARAVGPGTTEVDDQIVVIALWLIPKENAGIENYPGKTYFSGRCLEQVADFLGVGSTVRT